MFSSLRWPVTLALLSATILGIVLSGTYLFGTVRAELLRAREVNLRANAESIASLMGTHMAETALTDRSRRLIAQEMTRLSAQVGARLCVVNWKGEILEDSAPDGTPNVQQRPEISRALSGQYASLVRDNRLYLAVPVMVRGQQVGAIYAIRPLGDVRSLLDDLTENLLIAGLAAGSFATLLSFALAIFLIRPVRKLAVGVERISGGDYAYRLDWRRRDELGQLGRDIDQMAQRLEDHRAILMRFVSDASHELKTPLASLKVLSESLAEGALEDPQAGPRFVALIQGEVERMERLVHDMLTLQRGDSGLPLDTTHFDLRELTQELLELWQARGERGLTLKAPPAVWVAGDRHRIAQVLTNLIDNALTACRDKPEPRVVINLRSAQKQVEVRVCDNGVGLDAGDLERVFERFYRVDKARGRKDGGNGLGLAISRQIVEAHGGRIWVESEPAAGTTFTFTLATLPPLASSGQPPAAGDGSDRQSS